MSEAKVKTLPWLEHAELNDILDRNYLAKHSTWSDEVGLPSSPLTWNLTGGSVEDSEKDPLRGSEFVPR